MVSKPAGKVNRFGGEIEKNTAIGYNVSHDELGAAVRHAAVQQAETS